MQITFMGATRTVTGSKFWVKAGTKNILVDCGLFQGLKALRLRNWDKLPVNPQIFDCVILTHAHIDHSGYLPLFVKNGFSKTIYSTQSTLDLCSLLLPDSARLQEEEAKYANRHGYSKHKPALPLYTVEDAKRALTHFQPLLVGKEYSLGDETTVILQRAGHILGATFVMLKNQGVSIVFSGDIGRFHDPVMRKPSIVEVADYLVLESTYGDRLHEKIDPLDQLEAMINRTFKRGGTVIIPAFAVGRAQSMLYYIYELQQKNRIPKMPVFLDSPMATSATQFFRESRNEHRLEEALVEEICKLPIYVKTPEESHALAVNKIPKIIISASGMATGGRILHHLIHHASDSKNTIMFTGYQAVGTRGDAMIRGQKEIKMLGQLVTIKAEVTNCDALFAHADYEEILEWLKHFKRPPRKVFLTHGEGHAADSLKQKIEETFGWTVEIPEYLQKYELN